MARELNRLAMLAVGLLAAGQQKIEDLVESFSGEEAEKADAYSGGIEAGDPFKQIDSLVELGEVKYDEFIERVRGERVNITERVMDSVNDLVASFGLVTREDVEELKLRLARMEREI